MSEKKQSDEPELRPDGLKRFEKAVDAAFASRPKHKPKPKQDAKKEKPSR